jgi:hypothetical protein
MKTSLLTVALFGVVSWFCYSQDPGKPTAAKPSVPDHAQPGITNAGAAANYAALNRRIIQLSAQYELLTQLAQEHRKRADESPHNQPPTAQWETELAKELDTKASFLLAPLNNTRKERLAFEQAHPDIVAFVLTYSLDRPANGPDSEETAFTEKLEERISSVRADIAETVEAAQLYTAQLLTNSGSYDFSRVSSLLQENGNTMKQLQRELSDLELKKLEFRALRRY